VRNSILIPVLLGLLQPAAFGQTAPASAHAKPAAGASAEVKVGTGVEKFELTGAAETFQVAPGTRLYAWTRVTGVEPGAAITVLFAKDGKLAFQMKLDIKHNPYRTNAYRTFRAGDAGSWTAKVLAADGKELGSATFQVTLNGK
jgi:hypothetical protein